MKEKIDVKYINVPNICFSLCNDNDDRETKFKEQRIERGFDDSETWSLTDTICNFIIPRLKRFMECATYIPASHTPDEWNDVLNKILLALELITRDNGSRIFTVEEYKQIDEGLDLFRKWFLSLWW